MTNDFRRRVYEHKHKLIGGFTARYNITSLVYYEQTIDVHSALAREKQLKGWKRIRKSEVIASVNPKWLDLSAGWYEGEILR